MRLIWMPVRSHLFSQTFESTYSAHVLQDFRILEFNESLSSLLSIISGQPEIMKSYFPQMDMYYAQDRTVGFQKEPEEMKGANVRFKNKMYMYDGMVRLFDEGYAKTLFVNTLIPFDKVDQRFFYMTTKSMEAWILLLTKALAKYFGSYDKLCHSSFE